jgi:hypothetical protein
MEKELVKTFNTKLMGIFDYAFKIYFDWDERGCNMTQVAYIEKIIKTYNLESLRIKNSNTTKNLLYKKNNSKTR